MVAVLLFVSACGDGGDGSGAGDDNSGSDAAKPADAKTLGDASSGSQADARVLDASAALDAGLDPVPYEASGGDAGSERERALDPNGTRIDDERVRLVIEANCMQQVACSLEVDQARCEEDTRQNWFFFLLGDAPCVDAVLDQLACYARVSCDAVEECADGLPRAMNACLTLLTEDGGV